MIWEREFANTTLQNIAAQGIGLSVLSNKFGRPPRSVRLPKRTAANRWYVADALGYADALPTNEKERFRHIESRHNITLNGFGG